MIVKRQAALRATLELINTLPTDSRLPAKDDSYGRFD